MAEWSKAVDSKSTVGQLTGGSNPSLSANLQRVVVRSRGDLSLCPPLGVFIGEVRERLNRRAWRARGRQKCPVGSNPTLSAHFVRLTPASGVEDWVLCNGAL